MSSTSHSSSSLSLKQLLDDDDDDDDDDNNTNNNRTMDLDLVQQSDHLCYVRCTFCNTVLAVGILCKKLFDTVPVKCGHCNNLSFMSTRPPPPHAPAPLQPDQSFDHPPNIQSSFNKGQSSSSSASPFVVKPPEKKHRLPSAYNRFMKEEIQRIKAAYPQIPHREAFSAASRNWAREIPSDAPNGSIDTGSSSSNNV